MPLNVILEEGANRRTKNRVVFWFPVSKSTSPSWGCPGLSTDERKKVIRVGRYWVENGKFPDNREKFKPVEDGLFEIKCFQIRMIGFYDHHDFVIVLCVKKKKDDLNKTDVKKAKKLREEYYQSKQ